ncbi:MAG: hypothetical protein RR327_01090 [Clostridia bacterium]
MIKVKIAGKINLSLRVLGVKGNFHELDMATSSVNIFDEVAISPSKTTSCNLTDLIPQEKNTAYIAANLFAETFNTPCVDIKITKNIPLMAGLGGSSADAAGVIFGMMNLFDIKNQSKCVELARRVGSDVPLMLQGGFQKVGGTGEVVSSINSNLKFNVLTVIGCDGNSAKSVYEEFDKQKTIEKSGGGKIFKAMEENNYTEAVECFFNDLQAAAIIVNPKIQDTLDFLKKVGARKSIVYGSGSACGGIFDDEEQMREIERRYSDKFKFIKGLQTINKGIYIEK